MITPFMRSMTLDGQQTSGAFAEYPVIFEAGGEQLFGVFTEPQNQGPPKVAVVLLSGGGFIPMTHRNRMWVRLAQRLATVGFHVLRFDYHGVGESTSTIHGFWLDRPFVEDLEGAMRWLRSRQVSNVALVGSCFGARTILACAKGIPELRAAVFLSTPIRGHRMGEYTATRFAAEFTLLDYVRKAARLQVFLRLLRPTWREVYLRVLIVKMRHVLGRKRPSSRKFETRDALTWVSPEFLNPLRQLNRRRIPLLFLYGSQEEYYKEFQKARDGELGEILRSGEGTIEIRLVGDALHGFTSVGVQEAAIEQTFEWLRARRAPPSHQDGQV